MGETATTKANFSLLIVLSWISSTRELLIRKNNGFNKSNSKKINDTTDTDTNTITVTVTDTDTYTNTDTNTNTNNDGKNKQQQDYLKDQPKHPPTDSSSATHNQIIDSLQIQVENVYNILLDILGLHSSRTEREGAMWSQESPQI